MTEAKQNIEQAPNQTQVKTPKFYPKTIQAMKLVSIGETPANALKLVNNQKTITSGAVAHFNKKLRNYSLTRPEIVKLARNAVKDCLQDKPINNETYPTYSNKLAAAIMVYDRIEPVIKQNLNVNVNTELHPIDLSKFINVEGKEDNSQVIDVTESSL